MTTSAIAEEVATRIVRRHLETMQRLGIEYDLLPRESEILHLHFWDAAFAQLKERGVLRLETEGKNTGCWIMRRALQPASGGGDAAATDAEGPDEDAKVIVRSNGTVTYVGKDIAYHLWKFGLLGKDFGYRRFFEYPNQFSDQTCWMTAESGEAEHPHFGGATAIYNVIDARQSDPQANVIEALRGMGYMRAGCALHALFLRDGRAHAALRAGAGLRRFGRKTRGAPTSRSRAARASASRPTT